MSHAPSTLEGSYLLHLLFEVDWEALDELKSKRRLRLQAETAEGLAPLFQRGENEESGALYHVLGHKGDLMIVLARRTLDELAVAERQLAHLSIWPYLMSTWSYVSIVELSLHGVAERYRSQLKKQGLEENTPEYDNALEALLLRDKETQHARLFPEIPADRYICFYPMNKKRGESKNWFMLSPAERAKMMGSHGKIGRRYAGKVTQIISSSMGFDDFDWGVDLFAQDPVEFKKLIYEMRYDEVSAIYAEFGPFVSGIRLDPARCLDPDPWT